MRHWRVPAVFGAALVVAITFVTTTLATPPPSHRVTICHATNSAANPYIREMVDIASSGYVKAGHNDHTGPVFYDGAKDAGVKWGDIIPPYDYAATSFHFAGLNWTEAGEAIWDNDCLPVAESPSASFDSSQLPATDVPSVTPSFAASVFGETDAPTAPSTNTVGGGPTAPDRSASLLLVLLAVALGGVLLLTPRRSRS